MRTLEELPTLLSKCHSNDNGLVESKNGVVIRKHIGWGHIASQHTEAVDQFHRSL